MASSKDPYGIGVILKALEMIRANMSLLLLVFLPLYAIWAWAVLALANMSFEHSLAEGGLNVPLYMLRIFGYQALLALGGSVLAVMWHRAVLSPDAMVPPPGRVLGYIGWSFLIWLMVLVISLVPGLLGGVLLTAMGQQFTIVLFVIIYALSLVIAWATLRVGLVLPATSIGDRDMTMFGSIAATEGRGVALWIVAGFQGLAWYAADQVNFWMYRLGLPLADVVSQVVTALALLVGLAILTALYDDHRRAAPAQETGA